MSTIPKEFIHQLIERSDVVEILRPYVKLEKKGNNWFGLCPFHNEKTPSFSVNPDKGYYHCFGCGQHGNALDYMVHLNGGDFVLGVESLASLMSMPVPRTKQAYQVHDPSALLKKVSQHWAGLLEKNKETLAYLQKRGVNPDTIKRFSLGYASNQWTDVADLLATSDKKLLVDIGLVREKDGRLYDYFRHRLMVPIIDQRQRVVGFGGRCLDKTEPKYLNSPDSIYFSKRRILFGMPQAMEAARANNRLIICEGYMDVIMLSQHGYAESVATMGTAATPEQMKKAIQLVNNIVFAYDGDEAGTKGAQRAMENMLPALKDGVSVSFMFLPKGHDPDSYIQKFGAKAFDVCIKNAQSLSEFIINSLDKKFESITTDEGRKSKVMEEAERLLRLISVSEGGFLRQLILTKISQYTQIAPDTIKKIANKQTVAASRPHNNFIMRPESKQFNLLCIFEADPLLIEELPSAMPLPGGEQEVALMAELIHVLRFNMSDDNKTVYNELYKMGYQKLADIIKQSLHRRYAVGGVDIKKDFVVLVKNITKNDPHMKKQRRDHIVKNLPNDEVNEVIKH